MRNRKEIIDYLGLEMDTDEKTKQQNENFIKTAEIIEKDFQNELATKEYGYGLHCDFVNIPEVLDDGVLKMIKNYDGVVLYKIFNNY